MEDKDEQKRPIPERFRASTDENDEIAFARLKKNDEAQAQWKANVNAPFIKHTPKERERVNALILIENLENAALHQKLVDSQIDQLAEAYASIGDYAKAELRTTNEDKRVEYGKYWKAVWLDDSEWCSHPDDKKFIKDNIFSLKEGNSLPLLCCGICGMMNVLDAPKHLTDAQKVRAGVRNRRPNNMTIEQSLAWHRSNLK